MFGAEAHEAHDAAQGVDSDSVPDRSAFWTMRTPVIGAINGAAVGAGLTVPMLFDLRIVAEDAKLGFVFTRRGIVPDANICWLLPRPGRGGAGPRPADVGPHVQPVPRPSRWASPSRPCRRTRCWPRRRPSPASSPTHSAPAAAGLVKQLVYEFLGETDRKAAFAKETKVIWWVGRAARRHGGDHVVPREAHPGVDHLEARRAPRGPAVSPRHGRAAPDRARRLHLAGRRAPAPRQPVRRLRDRGVPRPGRLPQVRRDRAWRAPSSAGAARSGPGPRRTSCRSRPTPGPRPRPTSPATWSATSSCPRASV